VLAGGAFFAMGQGGQQQAVSYSLGPSDNHVATPPDAPPQPEPVAPQPQPFAQPFAQPEQPAQQVGPPDVSNYPMLSGFWVDDFQNYIQVSVSWSGQVAGAVTSGPLTGYALQGQFEETLMSYGVGNAQGMGAQSMGEWVDACHIEYLIVDAYGQPTGQTSMIHVNHFPNDPCP
jgi:hypothetical protein